MLIFSSLILSLALAPAHATTYTVTINVKDSLGTNVPNDPWCQAGIFSYPGMLPLGYGYTDSNGNVVLTGLSGGQYFVFATYKNQSLAVFTVNTITTISADATVNLVLSTLIYSSAPTVTPTPPLLGTHYVTISSNLTRGIVVTGGGSSTPTGTTTFWVVDGQGLYFTPSPVQGCYFDHWTLGGNLSGTSNANPLFISPIHNDISVTAVFSGEPTTQSQPTPTPSLDRYIITHHTTTGGYVSISPNYAHYDYGQMVALQAIPYSGYEFKNWVITGGLSGNTTQNPFTTTIQSNFTITAYFQAATNEQLWHVRTNHTAGGYVSLNPNRYSYSDGITVTATATNYTHYVFDHWQIIGATQNGTSNSNPLSLAVHSDFTLSAFFTNTTNIDSGLTGIAGIAGGVDFNVWIGVIATIVITSALIVWAKKFRA